MATETEQAGNSLKEDFSAEAVAKKHKFTLKAEGGTQQFNAVAVPPYYTPDEVMGPQGGELVGAAQVVRALADFEYGFLNRKAVRAQDIDAYAIEPDED
ncbi:MAG: hypothetical protein GC185_05605, partial [Alphaproteobacteria bacterium]|nr:hypothetical protein [Alphaproteobacteria bacterium]